MLCLKRLSGLKYDRMIMYRKLEVTRKEAYMAYFMGMAQHSCIGTEVDLKNCQERFQTGSPEIKSVHCHFSLSTHYYLLFH
jgi:hypothetical protein